MIPGKEMHNSNLISKVAAAVHDLLITKAAKQPRDGPGRGRNAMHILYKKNLYAYYIVFSQASYCTPVGTYVHSGICSIS
jgi:hypothetical protein